MRGWTWHPSADAKAEGGSPAHAGMDPQERCANRKHCRFPRACGDGPVAFVTELLPKEVPPRMRGWTRGQHPGCSGADGSPAHAGMDPADDRRRGAGNRFPRACGDGPEEVAAWLQGLGVPPRMRGWTAPPWAGNGLAAGSPAHAGMDPPPAGWPRAPPGFPRACGDGPFHFFPWWKEPAVPPRMRGWTPMGFRSRPTQCGSPAHAGMDPRGCRRRTRSPWFPRACGDGP